MKTSLLRTENNNNKTTSKWALIESTEIFRQKQRKNLLGKCKSEDDAASFPKSLSEILFAFYAESFSHCARETSYWDGFRLLIRSISSGSRVQQEGKINIMQGGKSRRGCRR